MKYLLAFALLITTFFIHAEIYRGVDEDGNVFYSDKEQPNSKLIPTPSPNTVTMPKPKPGAKQTPQTDQTKESAYSTFNIISPENDATIFNNAGNISINFSIEPPLNIENGHQITVYVDGKAAAPASTELMIQAANVSRGKHTLSAKVTNAKGKQIITSNAITIHMKRFSRKTPGSTPGPVDPEGNPYLPGPTDPQGNPYTPGPQGTIFKPGPIIPPANP